MARKVCPLCNAEYFHDGADCGNHVAPAAIVDGGAGRLAAVDADLNAGADPDADKKKKK